MKEREPKRREGWIEVHGYAEEAQALAAYEAVRDLVLEAELEASVFRLTLDGASFLAIVGEGAIERDSREQLNERFRGGEPAELPPEVVQELQRRRRAFRNTGAGYFERRTRWRGRP